MNVDTVISFIAFLNEKLDYVYCVFVVCFFSVGMLCVSLHSIDRRNTLWKYLGAFSFLQASYGLLQIYNIHHTNLSFTNPLKALVSLFSYLFLLAYVHAASGKPGHQLRNILYVLAVLSLVALPVTSGINGVDSYAQLPVGLIAASFAGVVIYRRSIRQNKGYAFHGIGILILLYGLIVGMRGLMGFWPGIAGRFFISTPIQIMLMAAAFALALSTAYYYHRTRPRKTCFLPVAIVSLVALAVLGWFFLEQISRRAEQQYKEKILSLAKTAAAAFDHERLLMNTADDHDPAYLSLREKLQAIRKASPDCRSISLIGLHGGKLISLVEPEPASTGALRLVGGHPDISRRLFSAFAYGNPYTQGPFHDASGEWITGFIPLLDEKGSVAAILAMDVKTEQFRAHVASARSDAHLMLLIIGVLIVSATTIILSSEDSTKEIKDNDERLRLAIERFNEVVDNALEWIWETDSKGIYTYSSASVEKILGYTPQEVVGKFFYDFYSNEEKERLKELAGLITKKKEPFHRFENRNIHKKGNFVWLLTSGIPMVDKQGNFLGYRGSNLDVSERKKIEERMEQEHKWAEEANKAKAKFLAHMSHEIVSPLNAIVGFSELLMKTPLNDTQKEYLSIIRETEQLLLSIINDILDFSKIDAKQLTFEEIEFNLESLIENSLLVVKGKAKENVSLAFKIDETIPKVYKGDPTRLKQVILNLLSNALKFTTQGSIEISVNTEKHFLEDEQVFRVLQVSVKDTGIGIPLEKQKIIFDPFIQADGSVTRTYGGTGLGLSIARALVERMGGKIWVTSSPGKGSTFAFTVQLKEAGADKNGAE
nr:sensory transduction histidine kinase [uncultured bacterium]